jgi:phage-related minor tail protein
MTMQISQLPRDAVELGLRGARLPLTVAERVFRRGHETSTWPPVAVFDKVEAGVKDMVGWATHDDTLRAAARLQRSEVAKREDAMTARAQATEVEAEAEARTRARRKELDAERDAVDAADAERERRIDEAEQEAHQRADKEAAAKRTATRTTAAKRKQAVGKRAARADTERLRAEADALKAEKAAVEARGETLKLDKTVQAKKSARRSG